MQRLNPEVSYNRLDENEFLHKLRILENGNCTYGGLLFLGNRISIEKYFPDFRIDLLEIPGTSYTDAKSRYTFRLDEYENLWEYYFECFSRLKSKVDISFKLTDEGFGMELSHGLNAIREALVNMLMHADYFSPSHSRIRIFTNHIEFYNPGGLPKPLLELKEKDISMPRNPIITKLFRMVKLAENAGYGLDKIESNWKEYNNTLPEYDLAFDSTILKLQLSVTKEDVRNVNDYNLLLSDVRKEFGSIEKSTKRSSQENRQFLRDKYGVFTGYLRDIYGIKLNEVKADSSERAALIISLIIIESTLTLPNIAEILGYSLSTIEKDIKELREKMLIDRIGSRKDGNWKITSKI